MDKELLISNIKRYCVAKGMKPTPACIEAGVGRNFLTNINRGQTPSVASMAQLAAYLDVSTSDLVGDARSVAPESEIAWLYGQLNREGQEILLDYAKHLVSTKKYTERGPLPVDAEAVNE